MTSDAGRGDGFTLLELIVVILLLTILLGFAIPAFQTNSLSGSTEGAARQLVSVVNRLKIAAMDRQMTHTLHLDLDQDRLWVTREEKASEDAPHVPQPAEWSIDGDWRITQVRLPGDRDQRTGSVAVGFYPQGYSDRAIIELTGEGEPPIELAIEAFLPTAFIVSQNQPLPF